MINTNAWARFFEARDNLAPTSDDEARISDIATLCRWSLARTVAVAWELIEHRLITTDAGMGQDPTTVEGEDRGRGRR